MTNGNDASNPVLDQDYHAWGLTKREYFASMALQGILANSKTSLIDLTGAADKSVWVADKLIEQLNKKFEPQG